MEESITQGQIGYAAYGKSVDFKNFQGNPMPTWENLPEDIKTAWEEAAAAISTNYFTTRIPQIERFLGEYQEEPEESFAQEFLELQKELIIKLQKRVRDNIVRLTGEDILTLMQAIDSAVSAANNVHGI